MKPRPTSKGMAPRPSVERPVQKCTGNTEESKHPNNHTTAGLDQSQTPVVTMVTGVGVELGWSAAVEVGVQEAESVHTSLYSHVHLSLLLNDTTQEDEAQHT